MLRINCATKENIMKEKKTKHVNIVVTEEMRKWLEERCEDEITISVFVRNLIRAAMEVQK